MTPQQIPVCCNLSIDKKNELLSTGAFTTKRDGLLFTNDDELNDPRETAVTALTAKCYSFDLRLDDDRKEYADILSKVQAGVDVEKLWEERVQTADGGLIVYITVLEYAQITTKTMERLHI